MEISGENPTHLGNWQKERWIKPIYAWKETSWPAVHRIASTGIVKGAAAFCLNWAYQQFPNVRIDTYKDNYPMQRLGKKCGFSDCGTFEMQGKNGWMAFQKTKTDEKNDADGLQSTKCSFE